MAAPKFTTRIKTEDPTGKRSMAYVSRSEHDALERRLVKAEQALQQQNVTIKILQTRLEGLSRTSVSGASTLNGLRARSRSPRPPVSALSKQFLTMPTAGADQSVEEFAEENNLDAKCLEVLLNQQPEVQQYVVSMGPAEGRNPSAMVMGRITKCTNEFLVRSVTDVDSVGEKVEDFIVSNALDEKCADALRSQSLECQLVVISQGPAEGRNASAMVMGRISKCVRGE